MARETAPAIALEIDIEKRRNRSTFVPESALRARRSFLPLRFEGLERTQRNAPETAVVVPARMGAAMTDAVTLIVYGWSESEPGTLSWVFPSVQAALRAVRTMRNAARWLIVHGRRGFEGKVDVDALRRAGGVLVERAA